MRSLKRKINEDIEGPINKKIKLYHEEKIDYYTENNSEKIYYINLIKNLKLNASNIDIINYMIIQCYKQKTVGYYYKPMNLNDIFNKMVILPINNILYLYKKFSTYYDYYDNNNNYIYDIDIENEITELIK